MKALLLRPFFRYAKFAEPEYANDHFRITNEMVFKLRQLNYIDQWKLSHANRWCHVLLDDLSFFTFSNNTGKSSFGYYPCPLDIVSISEYLREREIESTKRNRLEAAADYELAIETATIKESITPIRYDLDYNSYRNCTHPAAHLHIGLDNQVRLATRRLMTPQAFVLFVIRQAYPDKWDNLLEYKNQLNLTKIIRNNLSSVDEKYWTADDEIQIYLS